MINKHDFQQSAKAFRAGRLTLQEFTDVVFSKHAEADKSDQAFDHSDAIPRLKDRPPESHKGDFGRVVLIGGCAGMAGAIGLTGLAALKSGSGLVKVVVPNEIQSTVSGYSPCLMTVGCLSESTGEFHGGSRDTIEANAEWSDVVGLGPGLGRGEAQKWIVPKLYADVSQPMVVDADGLNTLVDAKCDLAKHTGGRVLTPHPGEFQRLIGTRLTNRDALENRARQLANEANLIVVLKGNRTLVTDGQHSFHNQTGNPGMATGGSGDVLTGVITSLIGQGLSLFDAAVMGVHVHGLAGDLMAQQLGETSLIATDLLDGLAPAFQKLHSNRAQS